MAQFQAISERYNLTTLGVPNGYPERCRLDDAEVSWDVTPKGVYAPKSYTADFILNSTEFGDGATPADRATIEARLMAGDTVRFDENGNPRNPHGRTGIEGRGMFGNNGPQYLGLLALFSIKDLFTDPKVLVIERTDNGMIALPGGYAIPGETIFQASTREAGEEIVPEHDFKNARQAGDLFFVPDPKTTDSSWLMGGVVVDFVFDHEEIQLIPKLDEVRRAGWMNVEYVQSVTFPAHKHAIDLGLQVLRSLLNV